MNLPWGTVIPIHSVKCTKLFTLYAFFNLVANVQILPRHFLPVFVIEWCLRKSKAVGDQVPARAAAHAPYGVYEAQ